MPKYHAFLSYSSRYLKWAAALQADLENCLGEGRRVWRDEDDIRPGFSWKNEIQRGLREARYLVLLVTPEIMASPWVELEWQSFMDEHPGRLLVVTLVPTPLPPFLRQPHAIDFSTEPYQEALARLAAALEGKDDPRARTPVPAGIKGPGELPPALKGDLRTELVESLAPLLEDEGERMKLAKRFLGRDKVLVLDHHDAHGAASAALVLAGEADHPEATAHRVIDIATEAFASNADGIAPLVALRGRIETHLPAKLSVAAPIDRFLVGLRASPTQPVEFFPEAADRALHEVHVEIDIERRGRESLIEGKRSAPTVTTLQELLKTPPDHDTGVTGSWLVLGEPGAGKSTIARHLEEKLAHDEAAAIPVYVSLAECAREKSHPFDVAAANLSGTLGQRAAKGVAEALHAAAESEDGRGVWLLLDGLDEVSKERFGWIKTRLRDWSRPAGLRVAILSRSIEGLELGSSFPRAQLRKLSPKRQRELLANWLPDDSGPRLADVIDESEALKELAGNPLLLTLLASIALARQRAPDADRTPALPTNRRQLYDQAIDTLLLRTYRIDGLRRGDDFDLDAARLTLEQVARALQTSDAIEWSENDLKPPFKAARKRLIDAGEDCPWRTLDAFQKDVSDVLYRHDGKPAPYRFLHRQFREYLTAKAIHREGRAACLSHVRELQDDDLPRWSEVFGLLCTLFEEPRDFLNELRTVSPALVRRALPDIEGMTAGEKLALLIADDGWDAEDLWHLAISFGLDDATSRERAAETLWTLVTEDRSIDRLAYVHHTLERIGCPPDREQFFAACGRPVDRAPTLDFVSIPRGRFQMGSDENDADAYSDERPRHPVDVPAFELARTQVTRDQYRAFDPEHRPSDRKGTKRSDRNVLPVTGVTWWQAWLFCRWIGARLPTEAEWEYACRAGTETRYSFGDDSTELGDYAWFFLNSGNKELPADTKWDVQSIDDKWKCRPRPVGQKIANPWDLYDMHGNVFEWCADAWQDSYDGASEDGSARVGPASENRGLRGGSFRHSARIARSAYRSWHRPGSTWDDVGFRPAKSVTTD